MGQPLDADEHLDPAVARAVALDERGLVVGEGVEVVLVVGDVVRQHGADADLHRRVAKSGELAVHVVHGRDAALDALAVAVQAAQYASSGLSARIIGYQHVSRYSQSGRLSLQPLPIAVW